MFVEYQSPSAESCHFAMASRDSEENTYSETWFELFLRQPDGEQTDLEVDFLKRQLPSSEFRTVLDLCCGYGRHAAPLAEAGYSVVGIDRDPGVVKRARALHDQERLTFRILDMTKLSELSGEFDAVICMWQSFGYFDAATNADVLRQIAGHTRTGGRLVLDIYNREFFETKQGTRTSEQHGVKVATTQRMQGDRLIVELEYVEKQQWDVFDWQVFTEETIAGLAQICGLHATLACADFDETIQPSHDRPRMQLLFEKR